MSGRTSSATRVLVIGLDMGDGRLIRHWCQAGELPNLARMMDAGTWLELETTAEALHTSTWPTLATGAHPGEHGVYYPYQPRPGSQRAEHISPNQYQRSTFWAEADRRGRDCLVYDIPETFPENGYMGRGLFEWGTFAWYGTPASQPEPLMSSLKSKFGPYPLKIEAKRLGLRVPDSVMLEKRLLASIGHKRETLQWLLDEQEWDLAVAGFCETHPAGHYLWPASADYSTPADDPSFDPLKRVYRALDEALGALWEALPDDAVFLVLSGDGVKPNHCGWHLLPEVMDKLGYTTPPSAGEEGPAKPTGLLARVKAAVPAGGRRWIADHLPWWLRDKIGANIQASQIDWSQTRAFTLPTDLEGYIRINLKGREPEGIVEPEQYDALCREIAADLGDLRNPHTGESAVRKVLLRNDIFPGPAQEFLPDLMVVWNDATAISALTSEKLGTVSGESQDRRTGTHSSEGFLLGVGPGITAQSNGRGQLADIGPAVLKLLGLEETATESTAVLSALTDSGSNNTPIEKAALT